jgi:AcrR family transcriptional regulator
MTSAILNGALRLLTVGGTDALTVRGLARELDVAPSALYRYVANRDELLTVLVVHAYSEMADTVQTAHDALDPHDLRGRWRAMAFGIRKWAVGHPHEFSLIYGTPVPGYHAPADRTEGPGVRVFLLLAGLAVDAERRGVMASPHAPFVRSAEPAFAGLVDYAARSGHHLSPATALVGIAAWHMIMGALFTEVFGHLGKGTFDADVYFRTVVLLGEQLLFGPPED